MFVMPRPCPLVHFSRAILISGFMMIFWLQVASVSAQEIRGPELDVRDVIMILAMTPEGANLEGLSFVEYDFSYLNFSNANLNRSILNGTKLHDTIFFDADMVYTDLSGSILDGAILRDALLYNASLSGASLEETDLRGANLTGANLTDTFIRNTIFDTDTIMPDGQHWSAELDITRYTDPEHPEYIEAIGASTMYTEESDLEDAINKPTSDQ